MSTHTAEDHVERLLRRAAEVAGAAGPAAAEPGLRELENLAGAGSAPVDRAADRLLRRTVRGAWEAGWQPRDLVRYGHRRLDTAAQPLLTAAVAAEHDRYAEATVHPSWRGQLRELGVDPWSGTPARVPWVRRSGLPASRGLQVVAAVAGFLLMLPPLPRLLPLPGLATVQDTAGRRPAGQPAGSPDVDERMLARIRALLAKAESTEFPQEAEVLSAKAQELMARYSLDRTLLDAGAGPDGPATGAPTARRIWLDAPYLSAKCRLVQAVASANRSRGVSHDRLGLVTVLGAEVDLQLVEVLTTSLLVQANRAMLTAGAQVGRFGQSRTRSFRHSFLVAYAVRIGERLRAAAESTQSAVDSENGGRLLPVLAVQAERVDAYLTELFPHTVKRRTSVSNHAGWAAGRTAADLANLDVRRAVRRG